MRTLRPLGGDDPRLRALGDGLRWWRLDVDGARPAADAVAGSVAEVSGWSARLDGSGEALAYAAGIIGRAAQAVGTVRLDDLSGAEAASLLEAAPEAGLIVSLLQVPAGGAQIAGVLVEGGASWAAVAAAGPGGDAGLARSLRAEHVKGGPQSVLPAPAGPRPSTTWRPCGARLLAGSLVAAVAVGAAGAVAWRHARGQPATAGVTATPPIATAVLPPPPPPRTRLPKPEATFGSTIVYDPPRDGVLVFGGVNSYDVTWVWRPAFHWVLQHVAPQPSGRFGAAAAYDDRTGTVVLFGGRMQDGGLPTDTWVWDGHWSLVAHASATDDGGPPGGEFPAMGYDAVHDQVVLVTDGSPAGTQTWMLRSDGGWALQPVSALPRPEAMAWDQASSRLLLVTAAVGSAHSQTWAWDGRAWTRAADFPVGIVATPADMAPDPQTGHAVLVASDGSTTSDGDQALRTWVWNGSSWNDTGLAPGGVEGLASDVVDHELIAFTQAGNDPSQPLRDAWAWSGSAWIQLY